MKKIKISLFAVAAILLGICGSAFTTAKSVEASTLDGWFIYNGGDKTIPSNYEYVGTVAPCDDVVEYCAMRGDRQSSPNQNLPTQASLNAAQSASSNFSIPVADLVNFEE